ncbi:helix-turn-helix domain-containing protein [Mesorhizobium sp. INR15]|uniref:helix-turn-helix domain-containing protein n=1 Tax=Mesorhizobium sp. INR15 TaxID=2654248 RepID=UPI0018969C93|nr:AraC family transcriptional regulator [Mesorhizobium sp. INR15]QPC94526.1 helix-turn-helix domain-containing protein [Mesorhizobium sp. INR15]
METIVDADHGFAFGEIVYSRGGIYGPLTNRYVSLIFVYEGLVKVTCDNETTSLAGGQAAFFKNDNLFLIEMERDLQHRVGWCEGVPGKLWESEASPLGGASPVITFSERLNALQRVGVDLGFSSNTGLNQVRNAVGQALYTAFFYEARINERDRFIPKPVQRAKKHIDENIESEITIGQLASIANLTPQHFISSFSKHLGLTPMRYLWQIRANRGRALLMQSGLSVSEIAYQCGYKNPFHFSRHIRQNFGMTPTEVRANKGYRAPSDVLENPRDTAF